MTQPELAERLGVSRSAVSEYERGAKRPLPEVALRAAQVLQLPVAYFYREPAPRSTAPVFNRSLASTTGQARERAEIRLEWLRWLGGLVAEHVELPRVAIPRLDIPADPTQLTNEVIESTADEVRRLWGLGDGPIADMVRLLESKGVMVARFGLLAGELDAFCQWVPGEAPYMVLNSEATSCVRGRHNVAHELAHLVLHQGLQASDVRTPARLKQIEQQANLFASAFLMPANSFADDVPGVSLDVFYRLKPIWKTSIQSMLFRSTQLGLVSESRAPQLWRNLSRRGWRKIEPLDQELEVEQPNVIRKAVQVILQEEIETRDSLLDRLTLPGDRVEDLAGLPPGSLSRSPEIRLKSQPSGQILRFYY